MNENLQLLHERVDDIPLLFGVMTKLGLAEVIDRAMGEHWLHQGLSNGWLVVIWLIYILAEGLPRQSGVQGWVDRHRTTLERLLGQPVRVGIEANDERLGIVLRRLSNSSLWATIEQALWRASVAVYDLSLTGVRLDSTTTYGYHSRTEEGLMQLGHSKDRRPDLPQVKLMAAAAEPTGQWLACDVVSGEKADDPLYTPLIQRVRQMVQQTGLLYTGDCKMAALATRAELVAHGDYYVTTLPMTGSTPQQFAAWVEAAVSGAQSAQLLWVNGELLGGGYEVVRHLNTWGEAVTWQERVQIFRSLTLAQHQGETQHQHLHQAETALWQLTPSPGRGKRQSASAESLHAAVQHILEHHDGVGLLHVTFQKQEQHTTRWVGCGRGGPNRPTQTVSKVSYVITGVQRVAAAIRQRQDRCGWRNLVTNLPDERMSLTQTVGHYRNAPVMENGFHLLKDRPLGISPLFVRCDDQLLGLTRLLTLRLLTLIQSQVRPALHQADEPVAGLYEGQPNRTTVRPTATRLLTAVARLEVALTRAALGQQTFGQLTSLPDLLLRLLHHLGLSPFTYTRLAENSP